MPSKLFSPLTADWARPLLASGVVRKLSNIIGKVARPPKRDRLTARGDSPRKTGGLADTDGQMLSRTLKLLERSVRAGEDLDPFAGPPAGPGAVGGTPSKTKKSPSKKKRARSKSRTPNEGGDVDGDDDAAELDPADLNKLDRALKIAKESVLAADCIIALLSADKLPKQVRCSPCTGPWRAHSALTAIFRGAHHRVPQHCQEPAGQSHLSVRGGQQRPAWQVLSNHLVSTANRLIGQSSLILLHVAKDSGSGANSRRALVGEVFQSLSSVFPRINTLIGRSGVAMSDKIIIQGVYIAIGPFFVVEFASEGSKAAKEKSASLVLNALGGTAALRGLRLSALALIRSVRLRLARAR